MTLCKHCESLLPLYYTTCPVCSTKFEGNETVIKIKGKVRDIPIKLVEPKPDTQLLVASDLIPDDLEE